MRALLITLLGALLLAAQVTRAQDYSECRSLCDRDYADCNSEPQASEPEEQTAKEAACSQTAQTCYAKCEGLKSPDATPNGTPETPPETPPEVQPETPPEVQPETPPDIQQESPPETPPETPVESPQQ